MTAALKNAPPGLVLDPLPGENAPPGLVLDPLPTEVPQASAPVAAPPVNPAPGLPMPPQYQVVQLDRGYVSGLEVEGRHAPEAEQQMRQSAVQSGQAIERLYEQRGWGKPNFEGPPAAEWMAKAVGWREQAARTHAIEVMPVVSGAYKALTGWSVGRAAKRFKQNAEAGIEDYPELDSDIKTITQALYAQAEAQARNRTIPADIVAGVANMAPWALEFYITGGVAAVGKGAAKAGAAKVLGKYGASKVGQAVVGLAGLAGGAAVRTAISPQRVAEDYYRRTMPGLALTPEGQLLIAESAERPATAFLKAVGATFIENLSEETGQRLTAMAGWGLRRIPKVGPQGKRIYDSLRAAWMTRTGGTTADFAQRMLSRAGYSGIIGEIGEERLSDLLRTASGIDAPKGDQTYLGAVGEALYPGWRQLVVELGIFAVPGATRAAAGLVGGQVQALDARRKAPGAQGPTAATKAPPGGSWTPAGNLSFDVGETIEVQTDEGAEQFQVGRGQRGEAVLMDADGKPIMPIGADWMVRVPAQAAEKPPSPIPEPAVLEEGFREGVATAAQEREARRREFTEGPAALQARAERPVAKETIPPETGRKVSEPKVAQPVVSEKPPERKPEAPVGERPSAEVKTAEIEEIARHRKAAGVPANWMAVKTPEGWSFINPEAKAPVAPSPEVRPIEELRAPEQPSAERPTERPPVQTPAKPEASQGPNAPVNPVANIGDAVWYEGPGAATSYGTVLSIRNVDFFGNGVRTNMYKVRTAYDVRDIFEDAIYSKSTVPGERPIEVRKPSPAQPEPPAKPIKTTPAAPAKPTEREQWLTRAAARVNEGLPAQEAKPEGAAPEPWTMRRDDYAVSKAKSQSYGPTQKWYSGEQQRLYNQHRRAVTKAIKEGKPVPRAVLQEYASEPWAKAALAKAAPEAAKGEAVYRPDPTVEKPVEGAGGFVALPGGKAEGTIKKPWLTVEKTASPDEVVEDFFGRTNRFPGPVQKLRTAWQRVKQGLRERFVFAPKLPSTPEYALARDIIRTMPEERHAAGTKAIRDVQAILEGTGKRQVLDPAGLDLLRRKVFVEDLIAEAERSRSVPEGLEKQSLLAERTRLDALIAKVPSVQDAYRMRQDLWAKVSQDLADRGVISEETAKNPAYVRHFVLDYLEQTRPTPGGKKQLQQPSRPYARERTGSKRDISTDYLEVELTALRTIYADNYVQDSAEAIAERYAVKPKEGEKPEGYVDWQFKRGNIVYPAKTITDAKIARLVGDTLADPDVLAEMKVPVGAMKDGLVIGGKRKTFVIPERLAAQLDDLPVTHKAGPVVSFTQPFVRFWKRWILRVNPIRYNKRNFIGDAERVNAAGRTHAFARVPEALKALYQGKGEVYEQAQRLGVIGSSLWHEMGGARNLAEFERYANITDIAGWKKLARTLRWPQRAGQAIQDLTQAREDVLRMSVFLDALEQVDTARAGGKPVRHWAGSAADIAELAKRDRWRAAAKVSRETLGDYGNFTPWENERLRNGLMPFWSWMKINTQFWPRVLTKAVAEEGGKAAGKTIAIRGARMAWGLGKWTARVSAAYAALWTWNNRDEEERARENSLPPWLRARPHINIPGGVIYEPSALSDFTEWFGIDEDTADLRRWEKGQITLQELGFSAMRNSASGSVNKVYQALNPYLKAPVTAAGTRTYPDIFSAYPFAKAFTSKAVSEAVLEILGADTKRFVDIGAGKRTLGEALSYYFSGSAYQPMSAEKIIKELEDRLSKATYKRTQWQSKTKTWQRAGEPHRGRERDVQIMRNRLESARRAAGT